MCLFRLFLYKNDKAHSEHLKLFTIEWWRLWKVKESFRAKDLPHNWQSNGFSSVWIILCRLRSFFLPKDLLHCWQLNILDLVWIYRWWEASWSLCVYDLSHTVHLYGFSLVWILLCRLRSHLWTKDLLHCLQLNILVLSMGTFSVWIFRWWESRWLLSVNNLPHKVQLYGVSPVWTFLCRLSALFLQKDLPHCWQVNISDLSTVILSMWINRQWEASWSLCAKDMPQIVQPYGFLPEWALICWLSLILHLKNVLHCWQVNKLVLLLSQMFCSTAISAFESEVSYFFLKTKNLHQDITNGATLILLHNYHYYCGKKLGTMTLWYGPKAFFSLKNFGFMTIIS
jgi:hypothetical protein